MVDVRKSFVVLALFALIAGGAYGQITCTLGNPSNPLIRAGGLTELAGTSEFTCTNLGVATTVNFGATMNTTISNRTTSASDLTLNGAFVQLFNPTTGVTTPATGVLQSRPETGDVASTRNRIIFGAITIPVTGPGTTVTIRIGGIRVVAPLVSTSFGSSTVVETVTTNPPLVNIPNPQVVVATVVQALSFDLRSCANGSFTTANFAQCVSEPSVANTGTFSVRFIETGFNDAFKTSGEEGLGATNGTRLQAKFLNVPSGMSLFVSNGPSFASTIGSPSTVVAPVVGVTGNASLIFTGSPKTRSGQTCGTAGLSMTEIPVVNGVATADWEVTADDPNTKDTLVFAVQVVYTANTSQGLPGLTTTTGPATVQGQFAPVSVANFADSTSPIPRFSENPIDGGAAFNISPCVTNLLFPYVTVGSGFDTGIAVSNTSLDQAGTSKAPFTTSTQKGACTAFYFTKPGATGVAPQTSDHDIAPGEVFAFALSQGGVPGATSTVPANFTGYMIVRCNFQFAHGFAFVSDLGAQKLAMGYLALVIPDTTTRSPRPFSVNQGNVGEILGN